MTERCVNKICISISIAPSDSKQNITVGSWSVVCANWNIKVCGFALLINP